MISRDCQSHVRIRAKIDPPWSQSGEFARHERGNFLDRYFAVGSYFGEERLRRQNARRVGGALIGIQKSEVGLNDFVGNVAATGGGLRIGFDRPACV
jgi:hypothetical protein